MNLLNLLGVTHNVEFTKTTQRKLTINNRVFEESHYQNKNTKKRKSRNKKRD